MIQASISGNTIVGLNFQRRFYVLDIQETVARFYNISPAHMTSASRQRTVARPRQVAMYLARLLTPMSYPELGRRFGGRDHTTVIHAFHQVTKFIDADPYFALDVETLRERLSA